MKKILCFIDNLGAGGAQRQFVGLACMLQKNGYQIKVITYQDVPFYKSMLDDNNIDYLFVEKAQKPLTRIYYIHKEITKYNPDWVISFLDTPCIISCVDKLFWHKKYKLLVSERNTTQCITFRERIKFFLYKCADVIVPNAYAQGNFIEKNFPKLKDKVNVIHNFVDLDNFSCKKEFIRKHTPLIVIAASIWGSKNTLGFIDAVKILKDKGFKCEIHWYGISKKHLEYLSQCKAKIQQYNLSDYIKLHDKTNQIKEVYHSADYFCLPSFYEGTPNVICEAMACGLPIICSDVCDNSRYVKEGINGALFNPKDPISMSGKIIEMLSVSDKEYIEMSTNSRNIAEKELSKESFISKYLDVIKHIG